MSIAAVDFRQSRRNPLAYRNPSNNTHVELFFVVLLEKFSKFSVETRGHDGLGMS